MSESNHVVVPFATFVERRDRLTRLAATLRDRCEVAVKTPAPTALTVETGARYGSSTSGSALVERHDQDQRLSSSAPAPLCRT